MYLKYNSKKSGYSRNKITGIVRTVINSPVISFLKLLRILLTWLSWYDERTNLQITQPSEHYPQLLLVFALYRQSPDHQCHLKSPGRLLTEYQKPKESDWWRTADEGIMWLVRRGLFLPVPEVLWNHFLQWWQATYKHPLDLRCLEFVFCSRSFTSFFYIVYTLIYIAKFFISVQGQHGAIAASSPAAQNHVAVPGPGAWLFSELVPHRLLQAETCKGKSLKYYAACSSRLLSWLFRLHFLWLTFHAALSFVGGSYNFSTHTEEIIKPLNSYSVWWRICMPCKVFLWFLVPNESSNLVHVMSF